MFALIVKTLLFPGLYNRKHPYWECRQFKAANTSSTLCEPVLLPVQVKLHSEIAGAGPPLLILHGLFGSSSNWRSIARQFQANWTTHCLDLRNHGQSPWAPTMAYVEMADDVRQYVADQGLAGERLAIVGHSMGGKVLMALALQQPSWLACTVVVDIAPVQYQSRLAGIAQAMLRPEFTPDLNRMQAQARLVPLLEDPRIAPFLMQNWVKRSDSSMGWRINAAAIANQMDAITDFPQDWASRQAPVKSLLHVIRGEHSDYMPSDHASAIASFQPYFQAVRLTTITGAGHWVHADQPEAFVSALRDCLANC